MLGVQGLLVDIDGVLVVSWQEIPGAAEALSRCRAAGLALRFLTNTTSVSRAEIAARLTAVASQCAVRDALEGVASDQWSRKVRVVRQHAGIDHGYHDVRVTGGGMPGIRHPYQRVVPLKLIGRVSGCSHGPHPVIGLRVVPLRIVSPGFDRE